MMVQFNLLPDVKLEYIKAQRTKHVVTFISTIVGLIAATIFVFTLFYVYVVQTQQMKSLTRDIKRYQEEIAKVDDVDKMLTVQSQLNSLAPLHEEKPVTSRVFGYIEQMTPQNIELDALEVDYEASTMSVGGKSPTLETVKVYVDAIKAAQYAKGENENANRAFTDVVLSSFTKSEKDVTFTITAKFDESLFDVSNAIQFIVRGGEANQLNQQQLFGGGDTDGQEAQ